MKIQDITPAAQRLRVSGLLLVALVVNAGWHVSRGATTAAPVLPSFTATQLLDKFAATQEHFHSFSTQSEEAMEWHLKSDGATEDRRYSEKNDFRFDGRRFSHRTYLWGNVTGTVVAKQNAYYRSHLWDGANFFGYTRSQPINYPGTLNIKQNYRQPNMAALRLAKSYPGREAMGYFWGDEQRVDRILRAARALSVRAKPESVRGWPCYVVEADTARGRYILWLSPKHGCQLAQAEVRRGGQDLFGVKVLAKGDSVYCALRTLQFEQKQNVWMPMVADIEMVEERKSASSSQDGSRPARPGFYQEKRRHKRTEVALQPDHEALGAFVPNDILNGTRVRLVTPTGQQYTRGCRWQDGRVYDSSWQLLGDFRPVAKGPLSK